MNEESERELRKACNLVERHLRAIGKDCEVIFTTEGVQVAPLSWSGEILEESLFDAIIESKEATK